MQEKKGAAGVLIVSPNFPSRAGAQPVNVFNLYTAAVYANSFFYFRKNCGRYYRRRLASIKEKSKTEQIAAKKYSANIYADLSKQINF